MTGTPANALGYLGSADGQILRALDIIKMTIGPSGGCRLTRNAATEVVKALQSAHDNIEAAASRIEQTQS